MIVPREFTSIGVIKGLWFKKEQCKLISQILNGKNSLGIFPNGFGKRVCFYLLPLLFNEIKTTI
jgi:superfamily II DNA helicase RecQ